MRRLSTYKEDIKLAYCRKCNELFLDDMKTLSMFIEYCPHCKLDLRRDVRVMKILAMERNGNKEYEVWKLKERKDI